MTGCSFVHENDTETYYNKCRKDVFNMNESFNSHMEGPKYGTNAELFNVFLPFKRQFHKMVKQTQTTGRQFADELFECVWQFCGIGV